METVIISKSEYKKIEREQKHLRSEVFELKKIVQRVIGEDLTLATIKRLLGRSQKIDQGGGIRFSSAADVKKYLRKM